MRHRTLRIVIYGRYRTLISIVIVLILAGAFLWGGTHMLNTVTGTAAPPSPTATVRPVIEQPAVTATPLASPTPQHPNATATPLPTATPNAPPKVFVSASEADLTPTTSFPTGLTHIWCHVRNSTLPKGAVSVLFAYYWLFGGANQSMFSHSEAPFPASLTTDAYWLGTSNPGKYSCNVTVDGRPFGSAHFSLSS